MRKLLALTAILVGSVAVQANYNWSSVQIWGGGYVPGIAFHPTEEGLAYIRTDVGGSYRLNADKRSWQPINDSLPFSSENDMGSIAIGFDDENPDRVYVTGGQYLPLSWCNQASFFRSNDRGVSWERVWLNNTTVSGTSSAVLGGAEPWNDRPAWFLCLGGNADNRGLGSRIAARGDRIYLGTDQNGLLMSLDRGDNWVTVAPFSNTSGISAVLFDKDRNVFAAPFAGGLFRQSPATIHPPQFARVGDFTGVIFQMSYRPIDNTIWFTTNATRPLDFGGASGGSVYKYDIAAETFTQITMPAKPSGSNYGYAGISVHPTNPNYILVSTTGWWKGYSTALGRNSGLLDGAGYVPHEAIFMSTDGGATWRDILLNADYDIESAYNAASHNPHWISALAIDPHDPNHVVFGTGYGMWSTFNAASERPMWVFTSQGIEETVPLGLVSTTSGAPLVSVLGDIDGFYHDDLNTPPLRRHRLEDGVYEAGTNYDIDFAGQQPNYMVRIHKSATHNWGAYSEDGGQTWKNFRSRPQQGVVDNGENNYVAVSADGSAIVWNMATNGVYFSTNHGATWTASSAPASQLAGFRPVADRVTPGTFYLYNSATGTLYASTNNGESWTVRNSGLAREAADWSRWAFRLYASPDQAGELWITQGADGNNSMGLWTGDANGGVRRSTNGGTTFTAVPGLIFARSIGFGKGRNAGDPSAVYAVGVANSTQPLSVLRSDNSGGTWTRINRYTYGEVSMVIGDPCIYSRVYLGTRGRGIIMGEDPAIKNTCAECAATRVDLGGTSPVRRTPVSAIKRQTLVRHGNIIRSSGPIQLYSLRGRLIASSSAVGQDGTATLNMRRVPNGVYIAKSGNQTLRVRLQK